MRRRGFLQLGAAAAAQCLVRAARARPRGTQGSAARVVIVGGGFAGASCALDIRAADSSVEVLLVDPKQVYVTCPMSNSVIAGLRSLGSISVPLAGLERRGIRLVRDVVAAVDPERRKVRLKHGADIRYDRLVVAPGIRFLWGKPAGYTEAASARLPHAWQAGPQTELLAKQVAAMRPGGVVAISVPAGPMRCPPGPFERASLMAAYLKARNPRAKVLIFDANNHFPKQEIFTSAWQALYPGMIEWIPVIEGGAVASVDPRRMTLATSAGEHHADVLNIIPPQAPAALAVESGLASDHGWCPVKPSSFESALVRDVYVIGDACIADPMPKSASAAHAQARRCASAVLASLTGSPSADETLESVCYSLLSADRALSIHGRFRIDGESIAQLSSEPAGADPAVEADSAERWYHTIRRETFAA